MRTNFYIDGFNLYYGLLKGSKYKWLDVEAMCERVLPQGTSLHRVRYFTAKITPRPGEGADSQRRQQLYLRALRSLPRVDVHLGQFLSSETTMKAASPPPEFVRVMKTEEKGSDVNIASFMLLDAFRNDADQFVVITNDSDLLTPLKIVKNDLGKQIGIFNPHACKSKRLAGCGPSFHRDLRRSDLRESQLPNCVELPDGKQLWQPDAWK